MDNYNDIVSAVQTTAEDTSAEFVAYIPTAIQLAEERLFRNLSIDFSSTTSVTTTNFVTTVAKPTGHRVTHNLYISVSGEKRRLVKKTEDFIYSYWPNSSTTGVPKYYADADVDNWILAPTPNSAYTITCEIVAKPAALSTLNTTNIFTEYYIDVLFYATMSAMADWMKDDAMKAKWDGLTNNAIDTINNEGRRYRQDDATNNNNPTGGRNILEKGGA